MKQTACLNFPNSDNKHVKLPPPTSPSVQMGLSVVTDGALNVKNQVKTKKKLSH